MSTSIAARLKIVWGALALRVIVILASGLYLWWQRRKVPLDLRLREADAAPGWTSS